jgi:hypothetical protein
LNHGLQQGQIDLNIKAGGIELAVAQPIGNRFDTGAALGQVRGKGAP